MVKIDISINSDGEEYTKEINILKAILLEFGYKEENGTWIIKEGGAITLTKNLTNNK
jgi:hypothetical protein